MFQEGGVLDGTVTVATRLKTIVLADARVGTAA
jgi:hypothetical protein